MPVKQPSSSMREQGVWNADARKRGGGSQMPKGEASLRNFSLWGVKREKGKREREESSVVRGFSRKERGFCAEKCCFTEGREEDEPRRRVKRA